MNKPKAVHECTLRLLGSFPPLEHRNFAEKTNDGSRDTGGPGITREASARHRRQLSLSA
jgi:hypothetical protein